MARASPDDRRPAALVRARAAKLARRDRRSRAFDFESGTLTLTEAGTKRRASLHVVAGEAALRAARPGRARGARRGLEEFAARLRGENHTLKRALTDPQLFSGIGNAYSDEILHAPGSRR